MTGRQIDVEGREVPAEQVGPPPPPLPAAPKKTPAPPAECAGQIPMPLPREVLLCEHEETPPLLLW